MSLRFALIMLNPQLVQNWKLIVILSHHIIPSTIFPSDRLLFTRYFLEVERDISFPHQLEVSQFMYCMTSLHHFTHSSWADEVIYLKSVHIITIFLPAKYTHYYYWASQLALVVKNPPANQETQEMWVQSLGQEDPLEKEMATNSSTLTWEIPWTEEPSRL